MAEQIPFSIVENVLSNLGSSAAQKIGSMYGVQKELKKLEETLSTLNAVVLDAEEQLDKSNAVKDWVKRLKSVVYDVDDLLDDSATHELQRGGVVRQISHFFSSSNQVAFRFQMSGRLNDIKEAFDDIKKDIFLLNAIPRITIHPREKSIERETHSSPSSTSIDQRNVIKEEIIKLLVSPNRKNVFIVALVGIGGLGKTTLAQLVYNDEMVKTHFEPKMWVCVSDEYGEGFGANALLSKITKSKSQSLDDLKKMLNDNIGKKKYLLVLDDVWNNQSENWETMRTLLEIGARGSKILVTTRNTEVSFMGKNAFPVKLKGLDEHESWRLFSDITFGGLENNVNPEIVKIGKEIVNMCNGVPLIINTLGRTLMQFKSDLSKWESIRKNENLLSLPYGNDNVLRVLKLSYDNLPTHLKQCFTYCALFPKDYAIEKRLLVQQWIAQGYIQRTNRNEELEDIGDQYFKELLSSSLLEEVGKDDFCNVLSCKMHDLVHDLAQSVVGSEVLVLSSDISNISREARHVSLSKGVNPTTTTIMGKPIRTFLNLCEDPFKVSTIVNSFVPSFMCLRVLSLSDLQMENVPKCLSKLSHLRYLDLSNNIFKILPNSITRLKNLQTLKLQHCRRLENFPKNMRELINLRHLENSGCSGLTHMPHGIGKLTLLQSLPLFVIGNDTAGWLRNHKVGSLSELKSLNQLRLLCIENLQNVRDVELASRGKILEEKECLQSLTLKWQQSGGDRDKWVMEGLQPNRKLKELFVKGYGAKEFPSWMMNDYDGLGSWFPNLIKIEISRCFGCNILPPFSQLPSLKSLKIDDMNEVEELKEVSSAVPLFPSLESLSLSHMPNLKKLWRMEGPSFSQLSKLEIHDCRKLASFELHLSSLSKLEINDCSILASLALHSSSSLSGLEIHNCCNLASLELHSSPSLSELKIKSCTNLASLELHSSPSLSKLEIYDCDNLASLKLGSFPSLSELKINYCNNLASLELHSSPSLSELKINYCNNLASLELHSSPSLSKLEIYNCSNLASLKLHSSSTCSLSGLCIGGCPNLASFKVDPLPSLETISLHAVGYNVIEQMKFVNAPSLKFLCIQDIDDMISLPQELLQHFSGLVRLQIRAFSALQSLELLSCQSLSDLTIMDCPNLASLNVASLICLEELNLHGVKAEVLRHLMFVSASSSLKFLCIWGVHGMISIPEEPLQYVSTLETLYIVECTGLATLLHWMGSLSSLRHLFICACTELTSLPEEIYSLKKLQKLYLCACPHLKERYNKETGEDRAKIAHIPYVHFSIDASLELKLHHMFYGYH